MALSLSYIFKSANVTATRSEGDSKQVFKPELKPNPLIPYTAESTNLRPD
jgi:hypothetical protein